MEKIVLLIKEVPEDSPQLMENTYVKQSAEVAYRLINEGYAEAYDSYFGEKIEPFLSEDYPHRNILFDNGIYTENQLKRRLGVASELNGIGKKSIEKYKELLFPSTDEVEEEGEDLETTKDSEAQPSGSSE